MCGITGIYAFNEIGRFNMINLSAATECLNKRGPDSSGLFNDHFIGLGHRRLSIIDTSNKGGQPMSDPSGRYTIVYNGEIFNFREIRQQLTALGVSFKSGTDTEVLLQLFIHEGPSSLNKLNGFFAFAIYDEQKKSLFIARDRMGIKPLLYYQDEDKLVFASEIKALLAYGLPRLLDYSSLYQYLQLNYIPAPGSIFRDIKKLLPGHYISIVRDKVSVKQYYEIPYGKDEPVAALSGLSSKSYEKQQEILRDLLEDAVRQRLISDVPLGAFLSGGIDSSVIVALASRHTPHLNTFSIGYRDEPFFDETPYADLVAKKFNTEHTLFSLSNRDLFTHLYDILDYIDEPFADSSAIPTYILSKRTRQTTTVALSGDGADELFAGYNKHRAALRAMNGGFSARLVRELLPLWNALPSSRNNRLTNKIRQLQRFGEGMRLDNRERYWRWACITPEEEAAQLLSDASLKSLDNLAYREAKAELLQHINTGENLNAFLYTDTRLVLPNDMLTKVDLMSMANGLEVRVPFLDHRVVEFAFQLPVESKINGKVRKRIVQDAFRAVLPAELYNRPKKGFEVPLLRWFKTELRQLIEGDLLADDFIADQGIFQLDAIRQLKRKLFSTGPGDTQARIWALIVFQWWWKKYMT